MNKIYKYTNKLKYEYQHLIFDAWSVFLDK